MVAALEMESALVPRITGKIANGDIAMVEDGALVAYAGGGAG